MRYISTRGDAPALDFESTLLTGLARDGGLYVPETLPVLAPETVAGLAGRPYEAAAETVMAAFVDGACGGEALRGLVAAAHQEFRHPARAPLTQIAPGHFLLELFHGPTLAFKDFAMQTIGQFFQAALKRRGERITIVGATSGDTGSAAIEAFRGLDNVDVFILYPHGRISEVQRRQMTTPDEPNVHAVAVHGDFDDCQAAVKAMFADAAFRDEVGLAAVNSINWGRVLAQTVYYITAAAALGSPHRKLSFTVPTGNFGDVFAGYIAKRMGLPIDRLVVATNRNDILHRTMQSGAHEKQGVQPTMSPSMDIQVSSNFERALFDVYDRDGPAVARLMSELAQGGFSLSQGALSRLREHFDSGRASEQETAATIRRVHAETDLTICPHTAVGVKVAEEHLDPDVPMVTLATAHPAKFPDAVEAATGRRPPLPERMADLYERQERSAEVANDLTAIQTLIRERRNT